LAFVIGDEAFGTAVESFFGRTFFIGHFGDGSIGLDGTAEHATRLVTQSALRRALNPSI